MGNGKSDTADQFNIANLSSKPLVLIRLKIYDHC